MRRGRRISLSEPAFVFFPLLLSGGSRVRSARRSAPRAARAAVAASPHRSRAIPLAIREVERSVACQGGHALPSFRLVFACALCKLLDACFPRPVGLACWFGAPLQVFPPVLLNLLHLIMTWMFSKWGNQTNYSYCKSVVRLACSEVHDVYFVCWDSSKPSLHEVSNSAVGCD